MIKTNDLILQAKQDYQNLKNDIETNKNLSLEELCDTLGGHNLKDDLFDINYGCITATVYLKNNKFVLDKYVDIWDDANCMLIHVNYKIE